MGLMERRRVDHRKSRSNGGERVVYNDLRDVEQVAEQSLRAKLRAMLPAFDTLEEILLDDSITFLEYIRRGRNAFKVLNTLGFPERNVLKLANHYQLVHPAEESRFFTVSENDGRLACKTEAVMPKGIPSLVERLSYSFDEVERRSFLRSIRKDRETITALLADKESATLRDLSLELLFRHTRVKTRGTLIGVNRWERGYDPKLEAFADDLPVKVVKELERPFVREGKPSGTPEQLRSRDLEIAWRTEEFRRRVEANTL